MKSRTAFQLTNFMLVYNLGLAALSLYMFTEVGIYEIVSYMLSEINKG